MEWRAEIQQKYRDVALRPESQYFFHTGRQLASRLGYPSSVTDGLPDCAIESFCGVGNPFELRRAQTAQRVVDVGSGAGLDCFIAAGYVGNQGEVVGVEMTEAMLTKSKATAEKLNLEWVSFQYGLAEELPIEDAWADVVISNGVFNLCLDKQAVLSEVLRCLKPGGYLQFADVATVSSTSAITDGFLSVLGWTELLRLVGFTNVEVGPAVNTFEGAQEPKGTFSVNGHSFVVRRPFPVAATSAS